MFHRFENMYTVVPNILYNILYNQEIATIKKVGFIDFINGVLGGIFPITGLIGVI